MLVRGQRPTSSLSSGWKCAGAASAGGAAARAIASICYLAALRGRRRLGYMALYPTCIVTRISWPIQA